ICRVSATILCAGRSTRWAWMGAGAAAPNMGRSVPKVVRAEAQRRKLQKRNSIGQEDQQCRDGKEFTRKRSMSIPAMGVRRWSDLSGADGGNTCATNFSGYSVDCSIRGQSQRNAYGRSTGARDKGCRGRPGERDQETRRHTQNGASKPRVCAFQMVTTMATA